MNEPSPAPNDPPPAFAGPAYPDASGASRWRVRVAGAHPEWAAAIATLASSPIDRAAIEAVVAAERGDGWRDEAHLSAGLRRARARVMAAIVDRDLGGAAGLAEVLAATTALAEVAIGEALPVLSRGLAARHGVPRAADGTPQDLLVVGMGKLGGGELNVSSDVDLIFAFAEDGDTVAEDGGPPDVRTLTNGEFFTRLGRRLIATLAETTADGFVFRVDMRLRPDGDAGPLVVSFAMLERYLVTSARDWERFAWIKGRVVSPPVFGDGSAVAALNALVTPFVYRRYLDFGAIDALRRLHGQIRDEAARREGARRARGTSGGARLDVKLGRGGIREIEFIAQHFQLVRGGRDRALRLRPTRATLDRLADEGLVDRDVVARLQDAYALLRNVEHRLQYLDDAQTHVLPEAADDRERIATMCARLLPEGQRGFDGLTAELERRRTFVETQFDAVFVAADEEATRGDVWTSVSGGADLDDDVRADLRERLASAGFAEPDGPLARLVALARGARLRTMAAASRARIDALVPLLIDASADAADPSATLARWLDLVDAIAGRSAYVALLAEYPRARVAVTRLLAASPWAAQYLTRHPLLLDELIDAPDAPHDARPVDAWPAYWRDVAADLDRTLAETPLDAERQMDVLREVHHAETFRLLIDDLEGRLTVESLSDQLSALADLVVDAAVRACWAHFAHGRAGVPDAPAFAVIAYGKLGGKELGYASDLDLVFLFDANGDPDAIQTYARFAQRLNVWLTARTTAGALFEIDLRLRPDGAAGLVVTSFDAWSKYERRDRDVGAWTWEHQALTRARFCAGDRALGAAFEAERIAILVARGTDESGRARLRDEIVAMRRKMRDVHPSHAGLFDLKHDDGGMVDVEFAVQYLVLADGPRHRELLDDVGNIALLDRAARADLVPPPLARAAADAYRGYRARQHALRLARPDAAARVDAEAFVAERETVRTLWRTLFG